MSQPAKFSAAIHTITAILLLLIWRWQAGGDLGWLALEYHPLVRLAAQLLICWLLIDKFHHLTIKLLNHVRRP